MAARTGCGRLAQHYTWREIHQLYDLVGPARHVEPRYNIAPVSTIDVVVSGADGLALVPMRWGIIPSWWRQTAKQVPPTFFNVPAESVAENPLFRSEFKRNRCIIPASGYFKWKCKRRYFVSAADGGVLSIAGMWDRNNTEINGGGVPSCTIIITNANAFTRMPLSLSADQFAPWLSGEAGTEILQPVQHGLLKAAPKSRRGNAVNNQARELVAPLTLPAG